MALATEERKLQIALELFEIAERIMLQNIRRRFPNATPAEVNTHLQHWLSNDSTPLDACLRVRTREL
jgi:hypothetical protein